MLLQFFHANPLKETAYICSPLKADDPKQYLQNLYAARAYMYYVKTQIGYLARAPHGYLPLLLDDFDPRQRSLALQFGKALLEASDVVLICGNRLSKGMESELKCAAAGKKKILVYDKGLYCRVESILQNDGLSSSPPAFVEGHPVLAHPYPQLAFRESRSFSETLLAAGQ